MVRGRGMMSCLSSWRPLATRTILAAVTLCAGGSPPLSAQSIKRTPTTIAALDAYPTFFHRRPVVVRATVEGDLQDVFITDGEQRLRVLNLVPPAVGENPQLEIDGSYWDVGRLAPDDPRLADHEIRQLSERLFNKPWPANGELPLLIADDARRVDEPDDVTIWTIGLEPGRYRDQTVTVTGRFRGRNLFGDLPEAPGNSPSDFVLQSANAAVWVVGKEPRGKNFDLDVMARVDTNRWLQVTGTVHGSDWLVEIEADEIEAVAPPEPVSQGSTLTEDPEQGPAPEVIFSLPTLDDTRVATDALVRFQFSRDMDPESFDGHVEAVYVGAAQTATSPANGGGLEWDVQYQPRNRVLNVSFVEPLLPYRTLEVKLGDGILATDGATLVAYSLSFTTGGS